MKTECLVCNNDGEIVRNLNGHYYRIPCKKCDNIRYRTYEAMNALRKDIDNVAGIMATIYFCSLVFTVAVVSFL